MLVYVDTVLTSVNSVDMAEKTLMFFQSSVYSAACVDCAGFADIADKERLIFRQQNCSDDSAVLMNISICFCCVYQF